MHSDKLRVFTSFAGYDSQCIALDRLTERFPDKFSGYELVGWSEIDENAIKAHNVLFPEAKELNYGDISKIDWKQVPDFDLFTYSSPCQSFSKAGKMEGGDEGSGTKSSLLWECKKAIEIKKPKYLLFENVPTVSQGKFVDMFNRWQKHLENIGYRNFFAILNSKNYGVAQNRERIFMVSIKNDNNIISYNFPNATEQTPDIKDILEKDVSNEYYVQQERVNEWVKLNDEMIKVNQKNRN